MPHNLAATGEETKTDVVFACTVCGQRIGFNRPGIGEPCAVETKDGFVPPDNPDLWMAPCKE